MASDLSILNVASAMARHATLRHRMIADNVANADTPGYQAKDLKAFDHMVARHAAATGEFDSETVYLTAFASPNGNTVSLEDQMVRSIEAQGQHDTAMTIYRKSLDLMRLSLGQR